MYELKHSHMFFCKRSHYAIGYMLSLPSHLTAVKSFPLNGLLRKHPSSPITGLQTSRKPFFMAARKQYSLTNLGFTSSTGVRTKKNKWEI
jgi:hypothetical protein